MLKSPELNSSKTKWWLSSLSDCFEDCVATVVSPGEHLDLATSYCGRGASLMLFSHESCRKIVYSSALHVDPGCQPAMDDRLDAAHPRLSQRHHRRGE
jgi:hypothetical protein